MRSFLTAVIGGAIFIFLFALALDGILSYWDVAIFPKSWWPDTWATPDSWSEWRDIVIVFIGALAALAVLLTVALLAALIFLVITARRLLRDNLAPAIDSLRESLDNVRGTAEFVGETTVSPIIRVYSVINGVRSGIGAARNLPRRFRERRGKS